MFVQHQTKTTMLSLSVYLARQSGMTQADAVQHSYPGQACPEEVTGQPLEHFLHVACTLTLSSKPGRVINMPCTTCTNARPFGCGNHTLL